MLLPWQIAYLGLNTLQSEYPRAATLKTRGAAQLILT
jgi:hypothetical protein